ncbi:MAG: ABC transporter permease [Betaproteobacteria bacterium AqS2]|uniref:Xylose transport system permease protein XylH n=1 Tax=Candidatus Amphirhobacter heronislandensis TaxID=1732024 RepID=A0A930UJ55_9GAMM|nr:ABC transporter permease [Betaproteobacteria bacterium AqS2]
MAEQGQADERLARSSLLQRFSTRPEFGAVWGALLVLVIFIIFAADNNMFGWRGVTNWMSVVAQLGIIAIAACLLMLAGEFDLSIGSMIAFSGMTMALLIHNGELPAWGAVAVTFPLAMSIGWLIGWLVIKTRLPSFIVTLAFLFILRGVTLVSARLLNGTTLIGYLENHKHEDPLVWIFGIDVFQGLYAWFAEIGWMDTLPNGKRAVEGLPMVIVWWIGLTIIASYVLQRTRYGNWIWASGGDPKAAMAVGVPVDRVKISLFVFSAFCSTLFAALQVFDFGSADAARGQLKELEAIAAAVIGGALLTGGYGTVLGSCLGALILGIVSQGFFYTGVDGDWYRVFIGGVLLLSVAFNTWIRKKATGGI